MQSKSKIISNFSAKVKKIKSNCKKMTEKIQKIDLRTPLQRERDLHRQRVVKAFRRLRDSVCEGTSNERIMVAIAEEMGCTRQNVRAILLKCGVIKRKK